MIQVEAINVIGKRIKEYLSLRTYPLGVKFYKNLSDGEKVMVNVGARKPLKNFGIRMTLCQVVNTSRTYGWTLGASLEDMWCINGALAVGMLDEVPDFLTREVLKWHVKDDEVGRALVDVLERKFLPLKSVSALVISPLETIKFEPDVVVIYGSPTQIARIAKAFTWHGIFPETKFAGAVTCSSISSAYLSGEPQLNIPCSGEVILGRTEEDEVGIAFPAKDLEKMLEGLEGTKAVFPYPPPKFSLYEPRVPRSYKITYKDYVEWKASKEVKK